MSVHRVLPAGLVLFAAGALPEAQPASAQTAELPPVTVTTSPPKKAPAKKKPPKAASKAPQKPAEKAAAATAAAQAPAEPAPATAPGTTSDAPLTATRTDGTAGAVPVAASVVTREDIERRQAQSLPEALSGLPGVGIASNGGRGQAASVFLRGTNSNHTLVLIDGVRVGSATLGTTAIQHIPLDLVDRIEVVRGPRAGLYGSEAVGGVVQMFTRKGGAPKATFSAGGGSFGSGETSATLSGGVGPDIWYAFGASAFHEDGFNACRGRPSPKGAGCFTFEPDKDGYENISGHARAGWRFAPWGEAEVNLLHTNGEVEYDGRSSNSSEEALGFASTRLTLTPVHFWKAAFTAAKSQDVSDNFLDGVFQSHFETRRTAYSWQNDVALAPGLHLAAGTDWYSDEVASTETYDVTSRDNLGVFGEILASFGPQTVQLTGRHEENSQFGGHDTGSAAWGYRFSPGLRFMASYGTAFRAPTFNELYFPGFGNPDLRPETSQSAEAGLSGSVRGFFWGAVTWSVNVFQTEIEDLIAFDSTTFAPANISAARIRGVETVVSTQIADWRLAAQLTLLDPENREEGPNRGNLLPRRAEEAFALNVDRDWGRWGLGFTVRGEGERFDDLANKTELDPYVTVDVRGEYRIDEVWRVQVKGVNLFDADYETAYLFNQPGQSVYVTLRAQK